MLYDCEWIEDYAEPSEVDELLKNFKKNAWTFYVVM